ncbi:MULTISPECIES: FkbM family methyltransferase [unclassified Roseivivax]|uniref:FkbM family methyltransferase n=1 Tax=Roseivivax sp. GX 12232 TaxID=2900547 RepID=UPI001E5A2B4C|nr:FkbM family methyltransferase [Roseivivax sp. GX 12232]MCE0506866.1 FkbM family methyltransferase [Roseivivax sp. GX 12232]
MKDIAIAATCHGVQVPQSPFLTETRIQRIAAARYEGDEIRGALAVVRPGDRVIELGAGLGLVGAVTALNRAPARILAFEPNPELQEHIRGLYALNGLEHRLELRQAVVDAGPDRPETRTFHIHASYLGSSLIAPEARRSRPVEVPTQSWAALREAEAPTVLLCDIEGGELDFLRAADLTGLRALVIEFHPGVYGREGMRECKRILTRAGFAKHEEVSTRLVWTAIREG